MYEGQLAETLTITGHNDDPIEAYGARPLGQVGVPSMVVIHHMPGWDEWSREGNQCSRLRTAGATPPVGATAARAQPAAPATGLRHGGGSGGWEEGDRARAPGGVRARETAK